MVSKEDLFGKQKSFMFSANFAGVCTSTVIELTLGMLFCPDLFVAEAMLFSVDRDCCYLWLSVARD